MKKIPTNDIEEIKAIKAVNIQCVPKKGYPLKSSASVERSNLIFFNSLMSVASQFKFVLAKQHRMGSLGN